MIKQNTRIKFRILQILFIAVAGLVIWSCEEEEGLDPHRPDIRLEGKDRIVVIPYNPKTQANYTDLEIVNVDYNPQVEEHYFTAQAVNINIWLQQKPLLLEIFKSGEDIADTSIMEFVETEYMGTNGYLTSWKSTVTKLGIALNSSQEYDIKVTYNDADVDGWEDPSEKGKAFTIYHHEEIIIIDLGKNLVGYWGFNGSTSTNLLGASLGSNLTLGGAAVHTETAGVAPGDGAAHVDVGSWYNVEHTLPVTGGARVNNYTMIWDIKVSAAELGKYICLLQFNTANDSDGSLYINPNGGFWFNGGPSDFNGTIQADTWHRLTLAVNAPNLSFYVDGVEIYTSDIAYADDKFSLDPSKFLILGENSSNDGNGEDNPISISSFYLFDTALKGEDIANFPSIGTPAIDHMATLLKGKWNFNNSIDLLAAQVGSDLTLGGAAAHSVSAGVNAEDGASFVDVGTWYNVENHGMAASNDGARVNEFTMIWDVKVDAANLGKYICLLQYNTDNDSDGALYINPSGGFWFNGGPSDFNGTIKADTWHRIVLAVNAPNLVFYVDGVEIYTAEIADIDGKFSLDPSKFLILGENSSNDGNGEDNPIIITDFMVFDKALTIEQLGNIPPVTESVL